jgi:hypothetical protein
LAAAGAGLAGEPEVLLPFRAGVGVRSGLAIMAPGLVFMGLEPACGGAWFAAAGAGVDGELDVLLPFGAGVGLRSGVAMLPGAVSMGFEPTGGGTWFAAAGAGVDGEAEVLDCANARLALPAMAKTVREAVRTRETIMGSL